MASVIRGDDNFDSKPYATFPIGVPFEIWDHLAAVLLPDNTGPIKFIRLTAGQSGSGGYNEGLLTDETVSGSAPLVEADAEIMVGPLQGQRVPLINTEMSFIRPGTSSGTLQFDEFGSHTHRPFGNTGNFFRQGAGGPINGVAAGVNFVGGVGVHEDTGSTGGSETRPKNRQATYYMRVV